MHILPEQQFTLGYETRTIENGCVIEGLFYQAKTGCVWRDMPPCFPSKSTIFCRRAEWITAGVFDALIAAFLVEPSGEMITDRKSVV